MSRELTWWRRHERMTGEKCSSFLYATKQLVCPLRWRFWYYITLKVSISFIVTLYYVTKICYKYLATGNSFALLHFKYLLGETTVREIVRDCCDSTWNCLQTKETSELTEDDLKNIANDFYQRTQFPNCMDRKHFRINMSVESGALFYNYKHFSQF
jgi:hypothetical protein